MLKWFVVILLVVLLSGFLRPRAFGGFRLGRLPGDLSFRLRGRDYHFPLTSTVLLSLLAWLLLRAL